MTVKEAVILAAEELGFKDKVKGYLEGENEEGKKEAEALLRCFNTVENEVALDYLPLKREEEAEAENGAVFYSDLARACVRVLRVSDGAGNVLPFRLFPKYLQTQSGKVKILYVYTPESKGINDESDFVLGVSTRLFAYGMAAEYCLECGLFEEAAVWDKKYKDALAAAYRENPQKRIRSRRWA